MLITMLVIDDTHAWKESAEKMDNAGLMPCVWKERFDRRQKASCAAQIAGYRPYGTVEMIADHREKERKALLVLAVFERPMDQVGTDGVDGDIAAVRIAGQ